MSDDCGSDDTPADIEGMSDDRTEDSLPELRDLAVDPDPELEQRVLRDINRRTLAADSLDFSLNVMLHTFWDHLRSLIEALPSAGTDRTQENQKED